MFEMQAHCVVYNEIVTEDLVLTTVGPGVYAAGYYRAKIVQTCSWRNILILSGSKAVTAPQVLPLWDAFRGIHMGFRFIGSIPDSRNTKSSNPFSNIP